MRTLLVILPLLLTACTSAAPVPPPTGLQAEIGDHLAEWRANLAAQRQHNMGVLQAYIDAGRFPSNHFDAEMTPVFVDEHGNRCAVAEMLHDAGHYALVTKVAQANNLIRVMDIKDGPVLEWILTSGLTQEECAQIQPSYPWDPPPTEEEKRLEQERWDRELREMLARNTREAERVRKHLQRAHDTLLANTEASVDLALTRLVKACRERTPRD